MGAGADPFRVLLPGEKALTGPPHSVDRTGTTDDVSSDNLWIQTVKIPILLSGFVDPQCRLVNMNNSKWE